MLDIENNNGAIVNENLNVSQLPPCKQYSHRRDIIIAKPSNEIIKITVEIVRLR